MKLATALIPNGAGMQFEGVGMAEGVWKGGRVFMLLSPSTKMATLKVERYRQQMRLMSRGQGRGGGMVWQQGPA